jgi:hypothetical protein
MRLTSVFVVLATPMVVACAHSPQSREESTRPIADGGARSDVASDAAMTTDPSAAGSNVRPLTFAGRCVPNVLRVPVRADIEPGRTPNIDQVLFLRPLCIADHGETMCHVRPSVIVDQGGRAFHGDGVGVFTVIYSDPARLTVSLEKFDDTMALADGLAMSEASAVVEDGCVTIPWTSDGLGKLQGIRGDFTRVDPKGPWMFRPSPRLCAATHVPGDDRVVDAAFPVTGKGTTAIPTTGLMGVFVTGTLRGPGRGTTSSMTGQGAVSAVVDEVIRVEWRVRGRGR